jgi:hypothetical protein
LPFLILGGLPFRIMEFPITFLGAKNLAPIGSFKLNPTILTNPYFSSFLFPSRESLFSPGRTPTSGGAVSLCRINQKELLATIKADFFLIYFHNTSLMHVISILYTYTKSVSLSRLF